MGKHPVYRILIPPNHWTPIANYVFTEELQELTEKKAAAVYLFLLDSAFRKAGRVQVTCAELSGALKMDERVVRKCLDELAEHEFIQLQTEGITHSHINKNRWLIPAAVEDISTGDWTPVPRFIVRNYIPAYHNAVLLPVLIHHHHIRWKNECWMGVPRLCRMLNWSPTRVRDSLRVLATIQWKKLATALPQPAEYKTVRRSWPSQAYSPTVRHYRVRAIQYSQHKLERARRMWVPEEFRNAFGIELESDLKRELSSILRYGTGKSEPIQLQDRW